MQLAHRTTLITDAPTLAITAKANQMKKTNPDILIFAAGEPDFDTPQYIKDAAIQAMRLGQTKYTASDGTIELKTAIVNKFNKENNLTYTANQILVSNGAKHCIYNLLQALIDKDDEVIIPAPYWVSYPDMVLLAGGTPVTVICTSAENYKLTPEKLKQVITKQTKLLMLNSPSNPTGMMYTATELRALADVLVNYPQIHIMTDDIYEHIIFDQHKFVNIANVAPELLPRIIVINGVSKAYAMTGWRIGYAACHNVQLMKAMAMIQSQSTSNPCSISQAAATVALNSGLDFPHNMAIEFSKRHTYLYQQINQINGLKCLHAQGAFYAFIDCTTAIDYLYKSGKIEIKNDLSFANYLLDKVAIALVPGSAFGLENHIRLSFATQIQDLETAIGRLSKLLN